MANKKFRDTLTDLGLTTNLKLCLDPGEAASYDPGVQTAKWLDPVSGYDWYRGSSAAGDAAEPTFNGAAGDLLPSTYWGFDDGDSFLYDSANEAWMENLHKDNAILTMLAWVNFGAVSTGASQCVFGNLGATTNNGCRWGANNSTTEMVWNVRNAGVSVSALFAGGSVAAEAGVWHLYGFSLDESIGASGAIFIRDGLSATATSTYASPSALAATFPQQIGAGGNSFGPFSNLTRFGPFAVFEGVALTTGQMKAVYGASRHRYYSVGRGLIHGINLDPMGLIQ